jgi:hypothetical protein
VTALTYATAAPTYFKGGWSPLPLPARQKSSPPTGTTGADGVWPNQSDIDHWCRDNSDGNTALRVPLGVIGIDIDDYDDKHGGRTLADLEARFGQLPPTWVSTSRGFGVSGIRLYRIPTNVKFPGILGEHIEVIQYHHRYLVVAPSTHPSGTRYRWYGPDGELGGRPPEVAELTELPNAWVEGLKLHPKAPRPMDIERPVLKQLDEMFGGDSIAAHVDKLYDWHSTLTADGWTLVEVHTDSTLWRRPGKDHDHSARLFEPDGPFVVFTTHMTELTRDWACTAGRDGDYWAYGMFGYIAATRYNGDKSECARDHRRKLNAEQRAVNIAALAPLVTSGEITSGPPALNADEDSFWHEREILEHILTASRARLVGPYAVLGCVLARVAAFTHPSTCLPPIIGGAAPLSLYVALRARSGGGKSSPSSVAEALIPRPPLWAKGPLPLGSGEGLIDQYLESYEIPSDDGKKKGKIGKRQSHYGVLFVLDEGQMVAEIGNRKGATILPTLRTAWSGSALGQANASIETFRNLPAMHYALGLVSLWQQKSGAMLLADADGGTPQRFVWLPTNDIKASRNRPKWPGELDWAPPPPYKFDDILNHHHLAVHATIEDEIVDKHIAINLHESEEENPLDAHRRLNKLKVAGCLAVLDGRSNVSPDDWRIAERLLNISDQQRDWVLSETRRNEAARFSNDIERAVVKETAVQQSAEKRALQRAARGAWRAVDARPDGATRRDVHQAIASRDRALVSVDEAIAKAIELQWITETEGRLTPGKARPK